MPAIPSPLPPLSSVTPVNGDVTVVATGSAAASAVVSGSGTATRLITLSGLTGDGSITAQVPTGTASDAVGNTASASSVSTVITVDNTALQSPSPRRCRPLATRPRLSPARPRPGLPSNCTKGQRHRRDQWHVELRRHRPGRRRPHPGGDGNGCGRQRRDLVIGGDHRRSHPARGGHHLWRFDHE